MDSGIRNRATQPQPAVVHKTSGGSEEKGAHPGWVQIFKLVTLNLYFLGSCICIHFQQFLGVPLYLYNRDWYYAWQALSKQFFGLLLVTLTEWWSPTEVRITWDESVDGQIMQTADGKAKLNFADRALLISNHQIYTDWVFLWWSAYAAKMHGHIFIVLKESIKYIPLLGPGMMFFSFIFLSRHWETDKPRLQHRLKKLKTQHKGPLSGAKDALDPMWLLLFPEGTTISNNGRASSQKWAAKTGVPDLKNTLLPRSRGMQFCLEELKDTVEWVYDCTVSYDGVPDDQYGQDYFTLKRIYIEQRGPKAIHMHWRRFAVSAIPSADPQAFDKWLNDRWIEKDALIEYYKKNGHFPFVGTGAQQLSGGVSQGSSSQQVVVKRAGPNYPFEFIQIFGSLLAVPLVWKTVKFIIAVVKFLTR